MTTFDPALVDQFGNPIVDPFLMTGEKTFFGQSDVEGNIGYFNELDTRITNIGQSLEVPLGAGAISAAFNLTVGSITKLTTIVSQFPTPPARIIYDANGNVICPIPGSYLMNFNFTITVTTPSGAVWTCTPYLFQGGNPIVGNTQAIPAASITNIPIGYNTLFYVTAAAVDSGQNAIGVGVLVSGVATAQVVTVDQQVDYIGNNSGNSDIHPNIAGGAILTDVPPLPLELEDVEIVL